MNLLHFFIPHHKNNHRSKLLHHSSLVFLILFFGLLSSVILTIHKTYPEVLGISYQISDQELLNLVNYQRAQGGLQPLVLDGQLSDAARRKAAHMFANNYWAHFAPDGTSPWGFIKSAGYTYIYAGENLAKGFTTSNDTVNAWMASPTHRGNIMSSQFKDVGFAISEGSLQGEDTVLIVQMFGSKSNPAIVNKNALVPLGVKTKETEKPASSAPVIQQESKPPNVEGSQGSQQIAAGGYITTPNLRSSPLFDLFFGTKAITFVLLSLLLTALVLDFIIVEKKKIPRIVGNNLDHIILLTLFMVFLLIAKLGSII